VSAHGPETHTWGADNTPNPAKSLARVTPKAEIARSTQFFPQPGPYVIFFATTRNNAKLISNFATLYRPFISQGFPFHGHVHTRLQQMYGRLRRSHMKRVVWKLLVTAVLGGVMALGGVQAQTARHRMGATCKDGGPVQQRAAAHDLV
jgi:hypothetical protein